ncbi:MAG: TetR/AcrR family transcriptional regulator [Sneathiellaceae bacterium]
MDSTGGHPPSAPADRRREIFEAAVGLFLERGYDNTPLSLVAERCGLSKAGLYHHVDSKEQLLFQLHHDALERLLLPILDRAAAEPDPLRRLRDFIAAYGALMGRDRSIRLLIDESKRLSPDHLAEIQAVWRRGYRLVRDTIVELQASGRGRSDLDPAFAAFAAIGMCSWTLYWFDGDRPERLAELGQSYADIFLDGLATVPAPRTGLELDR